MERATGWLHVFYAYAIRKDGYLPGSRQEAVLKCFMTDSVSLPRWLDDYIFVRQHANYCPSNADMTVIDWDKSNVLNYLGTYFPRSYAEAYCIYHRYFAGALPGWLNRDKISVFDFGCGTGGEVIGLLDTVKALLPNLKRIEIIALDGNQSALRIFEDIIKVYNARGRMEIEHKVVPVLIDDFYDLGVLDSVLDRDFDIIMSFKAICEFASKGRFEKQNPYIYIVESFLRKLKQDGMVLIADITTYNNVSQDWLPLMMDNALSYLKCHVVDRNEGYNQKFVVSHSKRQNDVSKVAWRILDNK